MPSSITVYLEGDIVEEHVSFTLHELSHASGASEEQLTLWVIEGVLDPVGQYDLQEDAIRRWRFPGTALRRAMIAHRLTRELDINAPGVALALDLLDELQTLRNAKPADR